MTFKRTYFRSKISDDALHQCLIRRESFVLEDVEDVVFLARALESELRSQGLKSRIDDQRCSFGQDVAVTMLPWWLSAVFIGKLAFRNVIRRVAAGRADVVIVMLKQSLDLRFGKWVAPPVTQS